MCYPEQKIVILGIDARIVEFDYAQMRIVKNLRTEEDVFHIEKVNDDTFLTGEFNGYIELIRKTNLTCLSRL